MANSLFFCCLCGFLQTSMLTCSFPSQFGCNLWMRLFSVLVSFPIRSMSLCHYISKIFPLSAVAAPIVARKLLLVKDPLKMKSQLMRCKLYSGIWLVEAAEYLFSLVPCLFINWHLKMWNFYSGNLVSLGSRLSVHQLALLNQMYISSSTNKFCSSFCPTDDWQCNLFRIARMLWHERQVGLFLYIKNYFSGSEISAQKMHFRRNFN